jgi:hypothetical protein
MRASAFRACLAVLLLVIVACHKVLGDYQLDEGVSCTSGTVHCVGNVLQRCNTLGTAWANVAVCASETLCDRVGKLCLPPTCAAGERRCQDAELQICNATRDGWSGLEACQSAAQCNAESGSCTKEPCQPGMIQCNGAVLRSCTDDQTGWRDLKECQSASLCNRTRGDCDIAVCEFGKFQCAGAELRACSPMLDDWVTVQFCDSEALCDAVNGTCKSGTCTTPGAFRCSNNGALERCDDQLTGWGISAMCESEAHCDAVNGMCTVEPCTPGAHQCSGARLTECVSNGTGLEWALVSTCESDGLCQQTLTANATTCVPPVCAAGETTCAGDQPQICNADRTGFRPNGPACATAELCNAGSGTCAAPVCDPNQTRCTDAQPQICNPGRTTYVANGPVCASAALCNPDTGTCGEQVCVADQLRCDPANPTHLQRCRDDLTGWEEMPCDICATPALCSASITAGTCDETSCKEPVCDAGAPHCGGTGSDAGKVLEMCNQGRTGYTPCQTCVTAELCAVSTTRVPFTCTPTSCTAPSCNPTDRWCGGTGNLSLVQCPPSRINTQPTLLDVCETNGLCEATRASNGLVCQEPSCDPMDRWCGGTGNRTLYQCPPSRINSQPTPLGTCATAALCTLTHQAGQSMCQAPACAVGATRCAGADNATLQMCNTDRTGFVQCDVCNSAALCTASLGATTCNANACRVCTQGQTRCNMDGDFETCSANGMSFGVTEECMGNGCDDTMGCLDPPGGGGAGG